MQTAPYPHIAAALALLWPLLASSQGMTPAPGTPGRPVDPALVAMPASLRVAGTVPARSATAAELELKLDDGSIESAYTIALFLSDTGEALAEIGAVYLNRFVLPYTIESYHLTSISTPWPAAQPNFDFRMDLEHALLLVYFDADGDGDPSNATRIDLGPDGDVLVGSLGQWHSYPVDVTLPGNGDIYIGFSDQWALAPNFQTDIVYPAAEDTDSVFRCSYNSVYYNEADPDRPTDLDNLANNTTVVSDDFPGSVNPGTFMIRASGTPTFNDRMFFSGFEARETSLCRIFLP